MTDDKLDNYFDKWWNEDNMINDDKSIFKFVGGFLLLAILGNLIFWGGLIVLVKVLFF